MRKLNKGHHDSSQKNIDENIEAAVAGPLTTATSVPSGYAVETTSYLPDSGMYEETSDTSGLLSAGASGWVCAQAVPSCATGSSNNILVNGSMSKRYGYAPECRPGMQLDFNNDSTSLQVTAPLASPEAVSDTFSLCSRTSSVRNSTNYPSGIGVQDYISLPKFLPVIHQSPMYRALNSALELYESRNDQTATVECSSGNGGNVIVESVTIESNYSVDDSLPLVEVTDDMSNNVNTGNSLIDNAKNDVDGHSRSSLIAMKSEVGSDVLSDMSSVTKASMPHSIVDGLVMCHNSKSDVSTVESFGHYAGEAMSKSNGNGGFHSSGGSANETSECILLPQSDSGVYCDAISNIFTPSSTEVTFDYVPHTPDFCNQHLYDDIAGHYSAAGRGYPHGSYVAAFDITNEQTKPKKISLLNTSNNNNNGSSKDKSSKDSTYSNSNNSKDDSSIYTGIKDDSKPVNALNLVAEGNNELVSTDVNISTNDVSSC